MKEGDKVLYLKGTAGQYNGSEIPLDNEVILGRDSSLCQIVFSSESSAVSGVHCKLQIVGGRVQLTDMGSTNGTFLDSGVRLQPNQAQTLSVGQGFYLGNRMNSFTIYDNGSQSEKDEKPEDLGGNMEKKSGTSIGFSVASLVCGVFATILGITYLVLDGFAILPLLVGIVGLVLGALSLGLHKSGKGLAIAGSVSSTLAVVMLLVLIIKTMIVPSSESFPYGCWTTAEWNRAGENMVSVIADQVVGKLPEEIMSEGQNGDKLFKWVMEEVTDELNGLKKSEGNETFISFQENGSLYVESDSDGTRVQTVMDMNWVDLGDQEMLLICKFNFDNFSLSTSKSRGINIGANAGVSIGVDAGAEGGYEGSSETGIEATIPPITVSCRMHYEMTDDNTLILTLRGEEITLTRANSGSEKASEE